MPCSCGDSRCSCLERCLCTLKFCTCTTCFSLKDVAENVEENLAFECIPSTSRSSEMFKVTNSDYCSNSEVINTDSLYQENHSNVFFNETGRIKSDFENCNSTSIFFPETNVSDCECEIVFEKQANYDVSEQSVKEEDNFSGIKSNNDSLQTNTSRKKASCYSSNNDSNYKCKRPWNNHTSDQISYGGFQKKTHIMQFHGRLHGWRGRYKNIGNRNIQITENNFSGIKSNDDNLKTSTRRKKGLCYSSNNDSNSNCTRSWSNHRLDKNTYREFPKKTHITRFFERLLGWRRRYKNIADRDRVNKHDFSGIKSDNGQVQARACKRKGSRYFSSDASDSNRKKSWGNSKSAQGSYHRFLRKIHLYQWLYQRTLPTSQVSADTLHSNHAAQQHIRHLSQTSNGNNQNILISLNRDIKVSEDNSITGYFTKKEDKSSEIKPDYANLKITATHSRSVSLYSSNDDSNSKDTRSWNNRAVGRNNFPALPNETQFTQIQNRPHVSTGKCDMAALENTDAQTNEDNAEYSNFDRYVNKESLRSIKPEVNQNNTAEELSISKPFYSNFKSSSSNFQTSRSGLFTQKAYFQRKRGKYSWYNPMFTENNEILRESISKKQSSFSEQQNDLTSSNASEMPKNTDTADSPTFCLNRQKKIPDLTVYDFDENETRNSPDQSYRTYLNSRKRCVNSDHLGKCDEIFYPTVNQRVHSEADTMQNVDKTESEYEARGVNPWVSFSNPSFPRSLEMYNDCEEIYGSRKRGRKRKLKISKRTAAMDENCQINEFVNYRIFARKPRRRGMKGRRDTRPKQIKDSIERKIWKKKAYTKVKIEKEKIFTIKNFIKKEIKEENPWKF